MWVHCSQCNPFVEVRHPIPFMHLPSPSAPYSNPDKADQAKERIFLDGGNGVLVDNPSLLIRVCQSSFGRANPATSDLVLTALLPFPSACSLAPPIPALHPPAHLSRLAG
jgi:hypothetical protein